jgi:hypothetical protein
MERNEITMHSEGYGRKQIPAVNVKCYSFGRGITAEEFGCSEKDLERALELAYEAARERFWEIAQDEALEILGQGVAVYSEGRSSGWLVVDGLVDPEDWDDEMHAKWAEFEKWCETEIKYLASDEAVREDIAANEWHKPGSQLYNLIDDPETGKPISVPDYKERERRYIKAAPKLIKALEKAKSALEAVLLNDDPLAFTQMEWEQDPLPEIREALKEAQDDSNLDTP